MRQHLPLGLAPDYSGCARAALEIPLRPPALDRNPSTSTICRGQSAPRATQGAAAFRAAVVYRGEATRREGRVGMPGDSLRHVLDGYKVLDFTQYVAGPTATLMMAEMGAEIIKVELAPAGDPSRRLP